MNRQHSIHEDPPRLWTRRVVCLTALCAALVAAPGWPRAAAQQRQPPPADLPPVTFRTEVRFIEVDAFVTDAAANPVPNLKIEDFEIYEDGRRQQIQSFSAVNLPIEHADRPLYSPKAIEPDVRTNEGGEGRIYMILLDDIQVHPSRVPYVRTALHQFIESNFGVNDLAAVVRVRNTRDSQDFTNNPRLLLKAIDSFTGGVPRDIAATPATGYRAAFVAAATTAGVTVAPTLGEATSAEIEQAIEAGNVSSRVRELAEFMAGVRGRRKAMLFVSEGNAFNTYEAMGQTGAAASFVVEETRKAIAAATRGNVTIYSIDPRSLVPIDPNNLSTVEGLAGPQVAGPNEVKLSPLRLAQDSLRELATETGGFASINVNDLRGAFERIVRENSAYYLLGYSPSNDRRDGTYRRLEVRVRRPGLTVRSRNGYTASADRTTQAAQSPTASASLTAVTSAIASPLPVSGLPLRVFAAPYRGRSRNATVVLSIEVDGSQLDFVEKDGLFVEQVEIAHGASDANGKRLPPLRHSMALNLKRPTYDRVKRDGLRVLSQMDLPPGRYQLRVAVGSSEGKAGAISYDLEVPDFSREPFTMSGLSMTSSRSSDALTLAPKGPLPIGLGNPLVTSRVFDGRDTIAVFGEVYENQSAARSHTVEITTELRTDAGAVVRKSSETRSSAELRGTSGGYGFTAVVPLRDLTPGIYVFHAEARLNAGNHPTTSRDVQIRVR